MVKAILFDFWGTLVENGVHSPIKQVKNILNIRLPFSEYVIRMEKAMMTQEFSSLKDAFIAVGKEFNIECPDFILDELVGMWNKSWMLAEPYEETVQVLEDLQKKYKLVLISNTDNFSVMKVIEKYNLDQYFEKASLSCKTGMLKTNPECLRGIVESLNLQIEDCVMVGDSLQSDIKAAELVGMKSILVDRRNSRDYSPKVRDLRDMEL
ncbi:HAD family hydrolase [Candidatus Woesearchaeota archaeon]|jgi:HAD superfamily hydrolase (TIGR01493 family)|nr:HAD family hydrolase [Candidatus Woesearchaeota archaeon]MBT4151142.1 HAD family hydrolase [Candidatus Woesearchaeota archaeon]MBT4247960.1 HAD family hydrolase [Candidatus Woesearchaeota archaeon]MBT4433901.1 HAD family hydrolase [Candidatus Woesearchaeota archaeon]MBT7332312.1 HAD family hydrolase [Candidatus Woesearchaeota archaeon]